MIVAWLIVLLLAFLVIGILCALGDQERRLANIERQRQIPAEPIKR